MCPAGQNPPSEVRFAEGANTDVPSKRERDRQSLNSRRRHSEARKAAAERDSPDVAVEFKASLTATNPEGLSVFQLNPTSITPAVEEMTVAFRDHIYHFQETKSFLKFQQGIDRVSKKKKPTDVEISVPYIKAGRCDICSVVM